MTNINTVAQTVTEVEVDALRATWDAAVEAERATWAGKDMRAVKAAHDVERAANAAWKAGERALVARWSAEVAADEEMRLATMCAAHDAEDEDYDDEDAAYHAYMGGIAEAMSLVLDHHYQNDSAAAILALDGDSPYGDGTTGWVQPTPAHPCYVNGVCDMDALSRYEDLAY
jgi:hypothetical protein